MSSLLDKSQTSNLKSQTSTICALATAPGGALGIIRISGPQTLEILSRIFSKDLTNAQPNTIHYGHIVEKTSNPQPQTSNLQPQTSNLKPPTSNLLVVCEAMIEIVFEHIKAVEPDLVVIDSIQTMATETVESSPGSVTQIRECAAMLLKYAKESNTPVIVIGHINKEGTIAGPKILEHMVDTVLQFEGDQHYMYRIVRAIKNRFGSTAELGIYEMVQSGLRPVENPSELLLSDVKEGEELSGVAVACSIEGVRPLLIETQALVSTAAYGTPQRSATGFDLRRLNMLLAVLEKRVGFKLPQRDVFLNIAGGIRVTDPAIDLSVIAAVLSSNVDTGIPRDICFAGEVGLSGEVRPVSRILQRIAEADKLGFRKIIVPKANMNGLDAAKFKIKIVPVRKVEEALRELFG